MVNQIEISQLPPGSKAEIPASSFPMQLSSGLDKAKRQTFENLYSVIKERIDAYLNELFSGVVEKQQFVNSLRESTDFAPIWKLDYTPNAETVTAEGESRNIKTGELIDVAKTLPAATEAQAGVMPSSAVRQINQNTQGIASSQADISNIQSQIVLFSDESPGLIASSNEDGQISPVDNESGKAKVNGWEEIIKNLSGSNAVITYTRKDGSAGTITINNVANAANAANATNDGSGNNIASTYLPKSGGTMSGALTIGSAANSNMTPALTIRGNVNVSNNSADQLVIENDDLSWRGRLGNTLAAPTAGAVVTDASGNISRVGYSSDFAVNQLVQRNSSGHIFGSYYNMGNNGTDNDTANNGIIYWNTDGYLRARSLAKIIADLGLDPAWTVAYNSGSFKISYRVIGGNAEIFIRITGSGSTPDGNNPLFAASAIAPSANMYFSGVVAQFPPAAAYGVRQLSFSVNASGQFFYNRSVLLEGASGGNPIINLNTALNASYSPGSIFFKYPKAL